MKINAPEGSDIAMMLKRPKSADTLRKVEGSGTSIRNWEMLCACVGAGCGRPRKMHELAKEYGLSVPRISQIVKTTAKRLSSPDGGLSEIARVRIYRRQRIADLAAHPLSNAMTSAACGIDEMTLYRAGQGCNRSPSWSETRKVEIVSGRKRWRFLGVRRWKSDDGTDYAIAWMSEPNGSLPTGFGSDFLAGSATLVFDCAGDFYVFDRSTALPNRLVVHLKRAKHLR